MKSYLEDLRQKYGNSFVAILGFTLMLHMLLLAKHVGNIEWSDSTLIPQDEIVIKLVPKKNTARQIVETDNSGLKQKSENAKYLGKEDKTYHKETIAKNVGKMRRAALGVKHGQKNKTAQVVKKQQKKKVVKNFGMKKFEMSSAKDEYMKKLVEQAALPNLGEETGKEKTAGLTQSNDFVEDIPLGDFTKLNTVEYKYYGFYFRIKQKLEQFWGRTIQEKAEAIHRSGRRLPASKNYVTSLLIEMDEMGKIINVKVKSSSGINELDEAATQSFNQAGPFPNPPKGLIKNGRAKIEWGFVVKS